MLNNSALVFDVIENHPSNVTFPFMVSSLDFVKSDAYINVVADPLCTYRRTWKVISTKEKYH